jgi:hypothetical protein
MHERAPVAAAVSAAKTVEAGVPPAILALARLLSLPKACAEFTRRGERRATGHYLDCKRE